MSKVATKKVLAGVAMGVAGLVLGGVGGCTVGPDYKSPEMKVPGAYGTAGSGRVAATQVSTLTVGRGANARSVTTAGDARLSQDLADLTQWWQGFGDPTLDSLIGRAVVGNLDVKQAEGRLRESRAQLGITASSLLPQVDANGNATRSRQSKTISSGRDASFGRTESSLYRAGFDATWELDVFGGIRRDVEASRADIAAAAEDRHAVITSLLAELSTNYMILRGAQQRIGIANDNIESQRQTLKLNEARLEAGISSEFDVARARAQVATFEATVPSLRITEQQAIHRIGVLLGESPDALYAELSAPKAIPMALPVVPVGLPSELLRRRPDIRRAERQLAAATARIGVATADWFPKFSLTGSLGTQSSKVARMADAKSIFYSIGPAVSWNIYDAGRIASNVKVQNERQTQLLAAYQSQILRSLEEVENAVVSYTRTIERREALARAVEASRRSVELATGRFAGGQGVGDLLDVLVAQRDLFSAEDALVASDTDLSQNMVAIYKSLGGGWETFPEARPEPRDKPSTPADLTPTVPTPATQPAAVSDLSGK